METKTIIEDYVNRAPSRKDPKVKRDIPLVEKEYLNLTAAAIYMKFNKMGEPYTLLNLTSQELIDAATNTPFYGQWDYMCKYVETKKKNYDLGSIHLEVDDARKKFRKGDEVAWTDHLGKTSVGEIVQLLQTEKGEIYLSISDGRKRHTIRASEATSLKK